MKKLLTATAAMALVAGTAQAKDVNVAILLGYTGPIESLTGPMADAAEMARDEINDSGNFFDGDTLKTVRADSTCIDSAAATAAAERLITDDKVVAIVGAACSGATGAVLTNAALPNGIPMISPSATSPGLSTMKDDGLFFRTSPSDARQGQVLADILKDRGVKSVAVTYTNNDYGKGLSDAFIDAYKANGGEVTIDAPHEDGKADYSAEIGALASAGGEVLVDLGYSDQGGKGIIQASLDTGAFDTFVLADGMYSDALLADLGQDMEGSYGSVPWSEGKGTEAFSKLAEEAGINGQSTFTRESYDAMALIALAMVAGGEPTSEAVKDNVMNVANKPGEKILPGELGKAMKILKDGGDVDYVGATNVELIGPGEAAGTYREYEIHDGKYVTIKFR